MELPAYKRRLLDALANSGRSARDVSKAAGVGVNFVGQLKSPKAPSVEKLMAVCNQLNVSITYILTGVELDKASEEFMRRYAELPPSQRKVIRDLLLTLHQAA